MRAGRVQESAGLYVITPPGRVLFMASGKRFESEKPGGNALLVNRRTPQASRQMTAAIRPVV
jgi:hypothetical protein